MSKITAGIDVSAKQLDVVVQKANKTGAVKRFDNDAIGHHALIKWFQQRKVQRVCLEATGVYHVDLAVALYDCGCFELAVLNPKVAHNYAKVLAKRSKNDAVDATVLAHDAQQMPFQAWQRPSNAHLAIRACARRLATLSKQRT